MLWFLLIPFSIYLAGFVGKLKPVDIFSQSKRLAAGWTCPEKDVIVFCCIVSFVTSLVFNRLSGNLLSTEKVYLEDGDSELMPVSTGNNSPYLRYTNAGMFEYYFKRDDGTVVAARINVRSEDDGVKLIQEERSDSKPVLKYYTIHHSFVWLYDIFAPRETWFNVVSVPNGSIQAAIEAANK